MPIEFTCSECGKMLRTRDERAGARAICPECEREITVPGPNLSETSAFVSSMSGAAGSSSVASPPPLPVSSRPVLAYCSACGAPRPEGAMYCETCGEPFGAGRSAARPEATAYAGFWLRFAALLLDTLIAGAAMGAVSRMTFSWLEEAAPLIWWLYYALMESSEYQATVGKMAVGLIVTDEMGERISFGRATARFFARIVSLIALGFGFLMAGFTARKQALHDIIAGCLVMRKA